MTLWLFLPSIKVQNLWLNINAFTSISDLSSDALRKCRVRIQILFQTEATHKKFPPRKKHSATAYPSPSPSSAHLLRITSFFHLQKVLFVLHHSLSITMADDADHEHDFSSASAGASLRYLFPNANFPSSFTLFVGNLFPAQYLAPPPSSICLWINADEMIVFLSNVLRFVRTGMFLLKVVLARYVENLCDLRVSQCADTFEIDCRHEYLQNRQTRSR